MNASDTVKTVYRVADFVSWQRAGTLNLSPNFQRRSVWRPAAKSYLIDTIHRGLPIPIIFLRDRPSDISLTEPNREVVDGQQRLRTIFSFIDPNVLRDYDEKKDSFLVRSVHNTEINNRPFSELDESSRRRILDYQFSVHVFPMGLDDREVLQIFARMNSTGVKLNDQELRNAQWFGEFKTSMYELATEQLPRWREWGVFTEDNIARMEEVEITSEFALLTYRGITGKSKKPLDRLYEDFEEKFAWRHEYEQRFRVVMDTISSNLGDSMRLMPFSRKTLFYGLFAAIYHGRYGIGSELKSTRAKSLTSGFISRIKQCGDRIANKTAPSSVMEAVARRTTNPLSRNTVLKYLIGVK